MVWVKEWVFALCLTRVCVGEGKTPGGVVCTGCQRGVRGVLPCARGVYTAAWVG